MSEQHQVWYKHKESSTTDTPHCFSVQGDPGARTNHTHTNTKQLDFCVQRTKMLIVWEVKGGKIREPAKLGSISPLPITGQGWTKEVDFSNIK